MMKKAMIALLVTALMQFNVSCQKPIPADLSNSSIIPIPVKLNATGSSYLLSERTNIYFPKGNGELNQIGVLLAKQIKGMTGLNIAVKAVPDVPANSIYLDILKGENQLGEERYELNIEEKKVILSANHPAGIFRGIQTILQIVDKAGKGNSKWIIPSGTITDYPTYAYRGMMLDVSRHFFGIEDVKRVIDLASLYKINVFHMHLSDDQGWRIEIKSWPKLTSVGGQTQVGGGEGGFYTQEQFKEIVQYARSRYITVIPEIDMPGHTNAASVAYPELNGAEKKAEPYTGIEVGFSTFDTRKEVTYQFVDDVIGEIASMIDGPFIHIGGDESHVTKDDDYVYFVNRVRDIVKKHNKKMIGWDEVAHADIDETDIVQYWSKKTKNVLKGVEKGAMVIMSPAKYCYLDMKYDSTTTIGLKWMGYIEVDQAYDWKPTKLVKGIARENILGIESPLWTETVQTMDDIEYLVFPRLIGHAEIGWSPEDKLNWEDYKVRVGKHAPRLKTLGVDFYESKLIPWEME